jgi:hypothetical protein
MRQIRNSAIIRAPVDTGLLRSSHDIKVSTGFLKTKGSLINRAKYAPWVHDGRRGFGPVTKKALKFRIKGVVYIRTRVGPQKAQPWMRDALIAVARKHKLRVIKK